MRTLHLATWSAAAALCTAASISRAQVTIKTSGGDVVQFSQKNLVDHMIIGDSIEVEAGKLAASRTQNAAVKELANMLVTDHSSHLDNLHKLAGKKDIGREANPADTSESMAIRMLTEMRSMPADSGFDREFVRYQIMHHMHEIDALKTLRAAAKDDDLQHDIDRTMPVLERHLAQARQVGAQLGIKPDSMRMTMPMPMPKPPTR
jgi:Predicted outer membrane protein